MTAVLWGGGGVSHPLQLTTGLVIKSVTTSPTLAGEHMLFILQVSILSEQILHSISLYFGDRGFVIIVSGIHFVRLLSHDTVCNSGRTWSGAVNFSRLNNPMGSFTHVVYGKSAIRVPCAAW